MGHDYRRTREQELCAHQWNVSNFVMDTAPPIYSRSCKLCGLVQHRGGIRSVRGDKDWYDAGDGNRGVARPGHGTGV